MSTEETSTITGSFSRPYTTAGTRPSLRMFFSAALVERSLFLAASDSNAVAMMTSFIRYTNPTLVRLPDDYLAVPESRKDPDKVRISPSNPELVRVALVGAAGFEPANNGSKDRCLTT